MGKRVFNIYIIYLFININIYVKNGPLCEKRQMGQGAEYLLKKGIIILVISEILTIVILTADTLGYL
jgi:hypothetical protein